MDTIYVSISARTRIIDRYMAAKLCAVTGRLRYLRIAQQIFHAFGVQIDNEVVRRVLAKHYHPGHSRSSDSSWLNFFAQTKNSLCSARRSIASGGGSPQSNCDRKPVRYAITDRVQLVDGNRQASTALT